VGKTVCNGVELYFRSAGQGSDIILIHGLAANHAFWRFDVLMALARDYRVTVFDLRGHGYSGMPSSGYTSYDMASDLSCLIDNLNISKAHLVGHSFGGVVALQCARINPVRVASLTLADSRVRALQPVNYPGHWPDSKAALKKLEEIGFSVPQDEAESGLWILEQLASPKWQNMRDKLKGTSLFIPFGGWHGGQKSAERWLELMNTTTARKDFLSIAGLTTDILSGIEKPTLAIYGEKSPALYSLEGLKKNLPDCRTKIVPGAGHFHPFTQPKIFIETLSEFLSELDEVQVN